MCSVAPLRVQPLATVERIRVKAYKKARLRSHAQIADLYEYVVRRGKLTIRLLVS
jgi:hypothetical protein